MLVRGSTFDRGKPSEIPAYFFSDLGALVRPLTGLWSDSRCHTGGAGGEIATPTTRQGQGKRPRPLLKNFGIFFSGQEIRGAMTCFKFPLPGKLLLYNLLPIYFYFRHISVKGTIFSYIH